MQSEQMNRLQRNLQEGYQVRGGVGGKSKEKVSASFPVLFCLSQLVCS